MLEKYIAQRFNNRVDRDHKAKSLRRGGYKVKCWKWNNAWTGAAVFHLEATDPDHTGAIVTDSEGNVFTERG